MKHDEVTLNTSCLICHTPYSAKGLFLRKGVCGKCHADAANSKRFKSIGGLVHMGNYSLGGGFTGSGYLSCGRDFYLTGRDWDLETGYGDRWFLQWRPTTDLISCRICKRQHLKLEQITAYVDKDNPIKRDCKLCMYDALCNLKCWEADMDRGFIPQDWKKMIYINGKWYENKLGG